MGPETRFLLDIVLLMTIAGVCSIVLVKLKLPAIFGYLAAGIVLGPTMFPELWVEQSTIDLLAGLGIVLLMFYIGLELNLRELRRIGSFTLIVVTIEMSIMVLIGYLIGTMLGLDQTASIFLGAIISGSSTAVVVGVLHASNNIDKETAKAIIGITVLEDIGQVLILTLAAPLLIGSSPTLGSTLNMVLIIVAFIVISIVLGATVIPKVLDWVGKRYSGEILLIIAIAFCFAMALASSSIGLSLAIGAFLMGTIASQSKFSVVIKSKVEPMKELFMAVFFISIGTQIYPTLVINGLPLAIIIAIVFILGKVFSVGIACYLTNLEIRSSFTVGIGLVAMGEFAFIIAKIALDAGLVDLNFYSSIIGAALITMLVFPFAFRSSTQILDKATSALPGSIRQAFGRVEDMRAELRQRFEASVEVRKQVRAEFLLIFVDIVVIISVQMVINLMTMAGNPLRNAADGLNIVPLLLLYLFGLVLITPAVFNTMMGIKRIASILSSSTYDVVQDKKEAMHTYNVIRNIGYCLLGAMLVLLFLPFISIMGEGLLTTLLFLIITWLVLLYFIWKTYKSAYDRANLVISKNVLEEDGDTKG